MMMGPNDADIVNDLIKVTIDSADGYRKAADAADNNAFQQIFYDRAAEREQLVDRMQQFVRSRGDEPVTDGSLSTSAHRVFLDLRDAITGQDDSAIIAEVERGEDYIKEKYENARNGADLSTEARDLIDDCYRSVKAGHDQMRDLKHGMRNQPPASIAS
jgi:uncharacterized protein (TIGR02284 family)